MNTIPTPVALWLAWIIGLLGVLLGICIGEKKIEKQAIRAGVAYYTNNASGEAQFKWKECK